MNLKKGLVLISTILVLSLQISCAVSRDQETVGAYIDDSVITSTIKSRFFEDKSVDGSAITIETLNGTVMLSGFVKNIYQKNKAEAIAIKVKGVKNIRNDLAIR